jgi:hypothetical protein
MKSTLTGWMGWLTNLGDVFLEAGKGLIDALWEGIKAAWSGLVDNVSGLMGDLRDLLPFSDWCFALLGGRMSWRPRFSARRLVCENQPSVEENHGPQSSWHTPRLPASPSTGFH